jgi:hypothetical protein
VKFIAECEERGIRILGMEFFVRSEARTTPVGGTAWDDLLTEPPERSWRAARDLLRDGIPRDGNVVVFVTGVA